VDEWTKYHHKNPPYVTLIIKGRLKLLMNNREFEQWFTGVIPQRRTLISSYDDQASKDWRVREPPGDVTYPAKGRNLASILQSHRKI
jgi:hypothetical protein